jgi:predicted enzyme related to lactoylglutathione lyase
MLQKLRTIIYHVNDLQKAKEWYSQLTGIKPYFDEPFYVGFDVNGYELGLDPDLSNVKEGNHTVSYWAVEDIDAAVKKALDLKAKLITPVTNVGGTTFIAVVEDPFGNYIGFINGA